MVRIALAAFHLIALGLGLGAVIARGSQMIATPKATLRIMIISHTQALLIVLIVFAAVCMARGYGIAG